MWPFSKIKKQREENERLREEIEALTVQYDGLKEVFDELTATSQKAIEEQAEAEKKLETLTQAENKIQLTVSDDLETITPFTSVKPEMWDTLLEAGMVSESVSGNSRRFAMQLALLTIASEGLSQLIEQFSPDIQGGE
ncbi:MAG: hypothetical protein CMF22_11180 [Idiomarinaceae bacterium]|nr:hypothetical protein [Idiomarinaceae bacterium]|tara:strand:+ start:148356 stop:148769 length:414 start_codon:yes stop_codon:yes gene_type:complete